jgi:hypothetical protein
MNKNKLYHKGYHRVNYNHFGKIIVLKIILCKEIIQKLIQDTKFYYLISFFIFIHLFLKNYFS